MDNIVKKYKRIAFVDDDKDEIILKQAELRGNGFEVVAINGPVDSVEDLMKRIQESADACICDHALQPRNYAAFYGAEPVAKLNALGFPSLLVTQFLMDQDVSMRQWRRYVPVVLSKEDADVKMLIAGFEACLHEIEGRQPPHRVAVKTILEVMRLAEEDRQEVVDVSIASWRPQQAVRLPRALIPSDLLPLEVGMRLIAAVNTGAANEGEIYFDQFERAPEPMSEPSSG